MSKRLLIALVGLGFVCALVMWLVCNTASTPAPAIPRDADASKVAQATDALAKPADPSDVGRTLALTPVVSGPAPADSTPFAIPAGWALVKVLVVDKTNRAALPDMEVYSMCDAPILGERRLESVHRSRGQPFEILVTDDVGRVEIATPANVKSDLVARAPGGRSSFATIEVPPLAADTTYDVSVELVSGFDMQMWIKVVDAEIQAPLSDVKVTTEEGLDDLAPATTDSRGLARIEARSWQQHALGFETAGHAKLRVWTESGHEREATALVVPLPRSATLRVHAVWAGGGPVVNADVQLTTNGYYLNALRQFGAWGSSSDPRWRGNTDDSGRLTLADLPPRVPIDAEVSGPSKWKPAEPIQLEIGEVRDVEWTITGGCVVTGSLVDQTGRPVTNQTIWLRKAEWQSAMLFRPNSVVKTFECFTDAAGKFRIENVTAGSWSIGPAARSMEAENRADDVAPFAALVEIAEGQRTLDLSLRTDRGLYIRGRVLDSAGHPAQSVHVSASEPDLRLFANTNRNAVEGTFALGPLMDGSYDVTASNPGSDDAQSETIRVKPGAQEVVLHLSKGVSVTGHVVGDDGNGVAGEVHITNSLALETGTSMLSVANDGAFSLSGLTAGTYHLSAMTSNGWIGYIDPVEIAPGGAAKDLVIRVSPGGRVRVRHEGPEQYAMISVSRNGVQVAGSFVDLGKPDEWPAPLGSVLVRAHYYDKEARKFVRVAERSVEVRPGAVVEVDFEKGAK